MRTSLLPGLLDALRRNTLQQSLDVRLFEISKVFAPRPGEDLPHESHWLSGLMYGSREEAAWNTARDSVDFFDLKGVVETLLEGLLIPDVTFSPVDLPGYLRAGARVFSGSRDLGVLGELQPEIGDKLDLAGYILAFNLDFGALGQSAAPPRFAPCPGIPRSTGTSPWCCLSRCPPAGWPRPCMPRAGRGWWTPASLTSTPATPCRRASGAWPSACRIATPSGP